MLSNRYESIEVDGTNLTTCVIGDYGPTALALTKLLKYK